MTWEHRCGAANWRDGAVGLLHQPSRAVDLHGEAISGRFPVPRETTTATNLLLTAAPPPYPSTAATSGSRAPLCHHRASIPATPSPSLHVLVVPVNPGIIGFYEDFVEDLYGNLGGQANMLPSQSAGVSCGLFYSDLYLPGSEHMECTNTGYNLQIHWCSKLLWS